jgi:IPT/TIG domain
VSVQAFQKVFAEGSKPPEEVIMKGRRWTVVAALCVLAALALALAPGCGKSANAPELSLLDPDQGPVGSVVSVIGANLGTAQGTSVIHVGSKVAEVLAWSDTLVTIRIPSGLAEAPQGVTALTPDGESNEIEFTVSTEQKPNPPAPSPGEIEHPTPVSAMLDYMKKNNINTSGWTFSVVKTSATDPAWKIDEGVKSGQQTLYFLLQQVKKSWNVVLEGTSLTPEQIKAKGAPADLQITLPPPTPPPPTPKTQQQVIMDYMTSKGIDTTGASIYMYKQSQTDPTWEVFYVDFPPEKQQADLTFILHQESGQWVVKNYGSGPDVYNVPGLPDDLKPAQ